MPEYIESEVIEGVKYNMSPTNFFHYLASNNLSDRIKSHLDEEYQLVQDVCILLDAHAKIFPDIAIFKTPLDITKNGSLKGTPVFVAEILSPSTRNKDTGVKLELYEKYGVREYWIVDPDGKYIEVYKLRDSGIFQRDGLYQFFFDEDWNEMPESEREKHPQIIKMDFLQAELKIKDVFGN